MVQGVVNSPEDVNLRNFPITLSSVCLQVVQFNGVLSSCPVPDLLEFYLDVSPSDHWAEGASPGTINSLDQELGCCGEMKCGNTGFYNSLSKANIPLLMPYLDVSLCSVYNDSYFACLCTNQDLLKYLKRKYRFIYHNYAVLKGYGKIKTQRPKSVFSVSALLLKCLTQSLWVSSTCKCTWHKWFLLAYWTSS